MSTVGTMSVPSLRRECAADYDEIATALEALESLEALEALTTTPLHLMSYDSNTKLMDMVDSDTNELESETDSEFDVDLGTNVELE